MDANGVVPSVLSKKVSLLLLFKKVATSSRLYTTSLKVVSFCYIGVLETSPPSSSSSSCWPSSRHVILFLELGSLCFIVIDEVLVHRYLIISSDEVFCWANTIHNTILWDHYLKFISPRSNSRSANGSSSSTSRETILKSLSTIPPFLKQFLVVSDKTDSHACTTHRTTSTDLTTLWAVWALFHLGSDMLW